MAKKEVAFAFRTSLALRKRLHKEARLRRWSLNTYLKHLVDTHQERNRVNNEEGN